MSNPTIPQVRLSSLVVRPLDLPPPSWPYTDGDLMHHELDVLLSVLYDQRPRHILEVGTFMGSTTRAMAQLLPQSEIHTVDLPLGEVTGMEDVPGADLHLVRSRDVGCRFRGEPCGRHITQHYCNTMEWDFSDCGAPDFIFIDGGHTYATCRNDSEKSYDISSRGAIMMWHDCDKRHPGVLQLLEEWRVLGHKNIVRLAGTSLAYWKTNESI